MLAIYAAGGAAVLHRRRRHLARVRAADDAHQRALRGRPDRRRRRLPRAHSAAEHARRARASSSSLRRCRWSPRSASRSPQRARGWRAVGVAILAVPARGTARRRAALRRVGHQGSRGRSRAVQQVELVLARRGVRPRARRLVAEPDGSPARAANRCSWTSTRRRRRRSSRAPASLDDADYLRYELTALAYHLVERPAGFTALVIGPGGGRDLLSALVFGATHVDGVEINPIIVARRDARPLPRLLGQPLRGSARVRSTWTTAAASCGAARRTYDVIQASLVDTWAATAAGAYTLTENSLYTAEAFGEYLDHLTDTRRADDHALGVRRPAPRVAGAGGVRRARPRPRAPSGDRAPRSRRDVPPEEDAVHAGGGRAAAARADAIGLRRSCTRRASSATAAPTRRRWSGPARAPPTIAGSSCAADREQFIDGYPLDIRADDRRPAVLLSHHAPAPTSSTSRSARSMLFGNGLSALLTLFGISAAPRRAVHRRAAGRSAASAREPGWAGWLAYFGALGAGFMLLEVALLQRFVLLLGHPVYSLTVTLFSLLLGTGPGQPDQPRASTTDRIRRVTGRALLGDRARRARQRGRAFPG